MSRRPMQPASSTVHPEVFAAFDSEIWFQRRVRDLLSQIFIGTTDPSIRRERMRRAIINAEIDTAIIGRSNGKSENCAQAFERLYGQSLRMK